VDTSLILQNVKKRIQLTAKEEELFTQKLSKRILKKKEMFHREGEISNAVAFVNKGCLRSYFTDQNGFEHVLSFAIEDWWISDIYSATYRQPGRLNIEALEQTEIILLSNQDRELLFEQVPKFERFFRILMEKSMINMQQRLLENVSLPAYDRFVLFVERYPNLLGRVPQIHLAAYLGITPEFLSKIKKEWLLSSSKRKKAIQKK
jgi:CRP-like cAMP-binding protein